jgi:hypothetical protein
MLVQWNFVGLLTDERACVHHGSRILVAWSQCSLLPRKNGNGHPHPSFCESGGTFSMLFCTSHLSHSGSAFAKMSPRVNPSDTLHRNSWQGLNRLSTAVFEGALTVQALLILPQCVHSVANWSPSSASLFTFISKARAISYRASDIFHAFLGLVSNLLIFEGLRRP